MNPYIRLKYIAFAIIAVIAFSAVGYAQQTELKEAKLKSPTANAAIKDKVEQISNFLKGVSESDFNIADKTLTVKYNPDEINTDMLVHVLKLVGYDMKLIEPEKANVSNVHGSNKTEGKIVGRN